MNSPLIKTNGAPQEAPQSPFATLLQRLQEHEICWNEIWAWFARILAVITLLRGFIEWAVICGFASSPSGSFDNEPIQTILMTILNAVLSLFAATGLWMLSAWGVVVWLLSMFLMIFVDVGQWVGWLNFGFDASRDLPATLSDIALVIAYFILTAKAVNHPPRP